MKYKVVYNKIKKNMIKTEVATFLEIEDAILWEQHIKNQGHTDVEVMPVF